MDLQNLLMMWLFYHMDLFTNPRTIHRAWIPRVGSGQEKWQRREGSRRKTGPATAQVPTLAFILKFCKSLLGLFVFTQESTQSGKFYQGQTQLQ